MRDRSLQNNFFFIISQTSGLSTVEIHDSDVLLHDRRGGANDLSQNEENVSLRSIRDPGGQENITRLVTLLVGLTSQRCGTLPWRCSELDQARLLHLNGQWQVASHGVGTLATLREGKGVGFTMMRSPSFSLA